MSMLCLIKEISDSDIESLIEDPKRVELLLNNGEYFTKEEEGFFKKLFSKKKAEVVTDAWKPDLNSKECDIDKAWDIVHNLLISPNRDLFPLNFISSGGIEIGDDFGYGPIRALRFDEVVQLNKMLEPLTIEILKEGFSDPFFKKEGIYPDFERWAESDLSWPLEECEKLKLFVRDCCNNKKGLFVYIY